jgi:hypothetical protein
MKKISFLFVLGTVNLYFIYLHTKQLHFFHPNQYDLGMDFFNTFYHTLNGTYYSFFSSVYTPLNFFILEFLNFTSLKELYPPDLRHRYILEFYFFIITFCLYTFYYFIKKSNISSKLKPAIFLIFVTSMPFLFLLERGNLLFFCLPFIFMVFHKKTMIISLAVLINLKIYFLFILPFFKDKDFKISNFLVFTLIIFLASIIFINQDFKPLSFILNLFNFNNSFIENTAALISLTYSPFTFESLQFYGNGGFFFQFLDKYKFIYYLFLFLTSFYFKLLLFLINIYLVWLKKISLKYSICFSYFFLLIFFGKTGGYLGILILPILLHLIENNLKKNLLTICLLLLCLSPLDVIFWQPNFGFRNELSFFFDNEIVSHFNYGIFQLFRSFLLFAAYLNLLYSHMRESSNISRRLRN